MRSYSEARKRWEFAERFEHDGQAWVEVLNETEDDSVTLTSAFNEGTYMGRGTILQRDVSDMPVHPQSEEMSAAMWDLAPFAPGGAWGSKTSLNTSSFGTQPIHMYVVDSTHPECSFRTFEGATAVGTPAAEVATYMNGQIPLPTWAVPAQNGDRGMSVYDLGTGIMREYFMVGNSGTRWWGSGGYSISRPGLRNLAEDNYALQQRRGISNVAGMHNSLGFIGIAEAMNKKINHALCFTASALWSIHQSYDALLSERATWPEGHTVANWPPSSPGYVSWPSRAADGKLERYIPESTWANSHTYTRANPHVTPTHGQWGRLPDSVDPMHNPRTGKPYPEFVRVIIEAAKRYGLVATDTNLWCHSFNTEQGRTFKHLYGEDPWATGGIIDRLYRDQYGGGGLSVSEFPWDLVEWAPLDWGRPVPDLNKRPGQLTPWFG